MNKFSNLIEKEREEERGGREFPGLRNTMVSYYSRVLLEKEREGERGGREFPGLWNTMVSNYS